jgi:hypothetical protein
MVDCVGIAWVLCVVQGARMPQTDAMVVTAPGLFGCVTRSISRTWPGESATTELDRHASYEE